MPPSLPLPTCNLVLSLLHIDGAILGTSSGMAAFLLATTTYPSPLSLPTPYHLDLCVYSFTCLRAFSTYAWDVIQHTHPTPPLPIFPVPTKLFLLFGLFTPFATHLFCTGMRRTQACHATFGRKQHFPHHISPYLTYMARADTAVSSCT